MKSILYLLVGALLASGVWYYYDINNPENRLRRTADQQYRNKLVEAQKQLEQGNTQKAVADAAIANMQHKDIQNQITTPTLALGKGCPDGETHDDATGELWFDIAPCTGERIKIVLPYKFVHRRIRYRAVYYSGKLEAGKPDWNKFDESRRKPEFKAMNVDSLAERTGENYDLKDDVSLVLPQARTGATIFRLIPLP